MTINFGDFLSVEQKQALLTGKIQQLAAEGYQLQVNRIALESVENSEQSLSVVDANISLIAEAIKLYQAELDNLQ
jgi:hypothetical protein